MTRLISPQPESFANDKEKHYWHMAQDTAYRVGASLLLANGSTWLDFGDEKVVVVTPERPDHVWFETWRALDTQHPDLSHLWAGTRLLKREGDA